VIERNRMSFFKLLFKAIKELTPFLNKKRISSHDTNKEQILYVIRVVMFTIGISMGFIFSWLHVSDYAPYYFTSYPLSEKYIVDSGILSEVYIRQGKDYLILTKDDGTKIRLEEFNGFDDLQEHYGVEELKVKAWWFPLKYSNHDWIAKMEMQGKEIVTEPEQKLIFNLRSQQLFDLDTILIFFLYALFALTWEFLVQYINYRQEHNARKHSE
jgi:hypothetical protein